MAKGQKTGGRQKGSRNKRTQEREEATAQAIALIGEALFTAATMYREMDMGSWLESHGLF
jgi:hypothetical protein